MFFADSMMSVLQCLKMAGQMISLVQSGLRNHSFCSLQHETSQENQFSLFLMVMALMKLLKSFALLSSIISLSYAFCPIPLTSCNLSMLVSSDYSSMLGWISVIALWNLLGQRCQKRISLRNTWRLCRSCFIHLLSSQHSKKVVLGLWIGPSLQTMTLQPAFHILQWHVISHHSPSSYHSCCWTWTLIATLIATWSLTVILTVILIQNCENHTLEHHIRITQLIIRITQACCLHQHPLPPQYLLQLTLTLPSIPCQH